MLHEFWKWKFFQKSWRKIWKIQNVCINFAKPIASQIYLASFFYRFSESEWQARGESTVIEIIAIGNIDNSERQGKVKTWEHCPRQEKFPRKDR